MTNLINRVKTIEKIFMFTVPSEIIPILTKAWKIADKVYYLNLKGQEREFIQSEHRETPIFSYTTKEEDVGYTP